MTIRQVTERKKRYLDLLLLADEQEDMIDRYLERAIMYVLEENGQIIAQCALTDEGGGVLELKSLSVLPQFQKRGYGAALIRFVEDTFRGRFHTLQVGTGDSPLTVPFYQKCGFAQHHRVKDFFPKNYDHPIVEAGVTLTDMVYLQKDMRNNR